MSKIKYSAVSLMLWA